MQLLFIEIIFYNNNRFFILGRHGAFANRSYIIRNSLDKTTFKEQKH